MNDCDIYCNIKAETMTSMPE